MGDGFWPAVTLGSSRSMAPPGTCSVNEAACPGGVLVDGRCWKIGELGESCDEVCGSKERVDNHGTIQGSGQHRVIDCLEDVRLPDLQHRACPPATDFDGACMRARRQGFIDEGEACSGLVLLIDTIQRPRWHCFPQFSPFAVPSSFRAPCLCWPPPPMPPVPPAPPPLGADLPCRLPPLVASTNRSHSVMRSLYSRSAAIASSAGL